MDPDSAIDHIMRFPSSPILFVDDFVGTGNQMVETWNKRRRCSRSFSDLARYSGQFTYVPIVATKIGMTNIGQRCERLSVCPAHCLDSRYSLVSDDSILWPSGLKEHAPEVLYNASLRAGIVADCEFGWRGFGDHALAVAFAHSVPDATLPLIFWAQDGWQPLIQRR